MKKKIAQDIPKRDVGPFLKWLRERMAGREVSSDHLRFAQEMSDRTQPDPNLPVGPSHKLYANYYYLRDPRRLVSQPLLIAGPEEIRKLSAGETKETQVALRAIGVTPGAIYNPPAEPKCPIRDPAKLEKLKNQDSQK